MSLGIDFAVRYPTQRKLWESDARLNFWTGTVRAGKGVGGAFWLYRQAAMSMLQGGVKDFLVGGVTIDSFRRNNEDYILEVFQAAGCRISVEERSYFSVPDFGVTIFILGGGDTRSHTRVRGMTTHSTWLDEAVLLDKEFVLTADDRMSDANSSMLLTTNADKPSHWLKHRYIDHDPGCSVLRLESSFVENLSFPDERAEELLKRSGDPHNLRMVRNLWVQNEGLIYDVQDKWLSDRDVGQTGMAIVDPGLSKRTAALYLTRAPDGWEISQEYLHDASLSPRLDAAEHVRRIKAKFGGISRWVWDPEDTGFGLAIKKTEGRSPFRATKPVNRGISVTLDMLHSGRLKINKRCTELRSELDGYAWSKTSDAPDSTTPHDLADCLRYAAMHTLQDVSPSVLV